LSPEDAENRKKFGCPICLPFDARIATPSGPAAVSELVSGAYVWSVDAAGHRIAVRVRAVVSVPVPPGHRLSVVELDDGRVLRASPGHPAADGRAIGTLAAGAELDDARVVRSLTVPYDGRTFDLVLEQGDLYFADGVLVKSSLAK
jgi:hypothetical protein